MASSLPSAKRALTASVPVSPGLAKTCSAGLMVTAWTAPFPFCQRAPSTIHCRII
jgi:hypothetical protein